MRFPNQDLEGLGRDSASTECTWLGRKMQASEPREKGINRDNPHQAMAKARIRSRSTFLNITGEPALRTRIEAGKPDELASESPCTTLVPT